MNWQERFDLELANASRARVRGNVGRARVCARRAAGIVAAEYLERLGTAFRPRNAMDALQQLLLDNRTPPSVESVVANLIRAVDKEFKLPDGTDLVSEARRLREALLPAIDSS